MTEISQPQLKSGLRTGALARRDAMGETGRRAASALVCRSLAAHVILPAVADRRPVISAFLPIRSEVDLTPLIDEIRNAGTAVVLPAVTPAGLAFRQWREGEDLVPAGFGTSAPPPDAPLLVPDLMLVPLAAFDRRGGRIGYGKGYYDAAIADFIAKGAIPLLIGVAFACQEEPGVPMEPHDRRMDAIVTEREIIGSR